MKIRPAQPRGWRRPELPDLVLSGGFATLILVCLFIVAAPGYRRLHERARIAAVRGNAATIQFAAETYASAHAGRYPEDPMDLLPYLPGDAPPRNPYTGEGSRFARDAGDLTYSSPTRGRDYVIQAWGRSRDGRAELIATIKGRAPRNR